MPWDPMKGERLAPAWTAALETLEDGEWHTWEEVLQAMTEASDILPRTCAGLIYAGVRNGALLKRGKYNQRFKKDHRQLRRSR